LHVALAITGTVQLKLFSRNVTMPTTSKLFSRFDPDSKENDRFREDLRSLLALTGEQLSACIRTAPLLRLADTKTKLNDVADELARATGLTHITLNEVWRVMRFFIDSLMEASEGDLEGDSVEKWVEDLHVLHCVSTSEQAALAGILARLAEEVVKPIRQDVVRRRYAAGVLPTLRSFGATVEVRAIRRKEYDWDSPIDAYTSAIADLTPVASVHIWVTKGTPEDLYFQIEEVDLDRLIRCLEALKKDFRALAEHLHLSERGTANV
jgi:hypothetical protein